MIYIAGCGRSRHAEFDGQIVPENYEDYDRLHITTLNRAVKYAIEVECQHRMDAYAGKIYEMDRSKLRTQLEDIFLNDLKKVYRDRSLRFDLKATKLVKCKLDKSHHQPEQFKGCTSIDLTETKLPSLGKCGTADCIFEAEFCSDCFCRIRKECYQITIAKKHGLDENYTKLLLESAGFLKDN
jgi:hypothetical protein